MESDRLWLGESESLGPFARAGLGILLAQGDWTWWHHPAAASTVMLNAIRPSGLVLWGGDNAVLTAYEWLDANIAIEVANAFKTLVAKRGLDLKVKIQRNVHKWAGEQAVAAVVTDLEKVFPRSQIYPEWPIDRRPRRIPTDVLGNALTIISSPELKISAERLAGAIYGANLASSANFASIAIGSLDYVLSAHYSATLVIVVSESKSEVMTQLDLIREKSGAQAALFLPLEYIESSDWFLTFGNGINSGFSILDAVELANKKVVRAAEFLAVTQQFIFKSKKLINPQKEQFSRKSLSKISSSEALANSPPRELRPSLTLPYSNLEIEGIRMQALPPVARMLRATAMLGEEKVEYFPQSGSINIFVSIGPMSPLESTMTVFPDHKLNWDHDEVLLQIHMLQLDVQAGTQQIKVPRTGASERVKFELKISPEQEIDVRFIVAQDARILQTSRLKGRPLGKILFYIESMNSAVDHKKNTFDLALLVNDSLGDRPSATILTKDGIRLELLEEYELATAREEMRSILESCVKDPTRPIGPMLFELANRGKLIFDSLKYNTVGWPDRLDRVQLTTQGDKFFPLEYLYDGNIPENDNGGLCADRKDCLTSGAAKEGCAIRSSARQLCPMGFLGISSIIERQTWSKDMDKATWLRHAKDPESRRKITNLSKTIFAAANRADNFTKEDVGEGFDIVKICDIECHTGYRQTSWDEWKSKVVALQPNLIVLLPHIENCCLYIGEDEILAFGAINEIHLGLAEPVVIAMGCNSAVAFAGAAGLPAALLRRGARIVVAALTGILGRYANVATRDLASMLISTAAGYEFTTIGSILTGLRRRYLANDNPLGLVIVAFGDADYVVGSGENDKV